MVVYNIRSTVETGKNRQLNKGHQKVSTSNWKFSQFFPKRVIRKLFGLRIFPRPPKLGAKSSPMVSIHLYSASCSAHQSEALPVRETREKRAVILYDIVTN